MSDIQTETETQQRDSTVQQSVRDSVITYSTDVVDSSIADTQTIETYSTKPKSITQENTPFYRRKRFWAICAAVNVVLTVISIPLIILVIFPAVAQKTVNQSKLDLSSIVIASPNNETFLMTSAGSVTNGGPFKSTIVFQSPVTMYWEGSEIGNVEFDPIHVSGGGASTNISNKTFIITNGTGLSDFSVALLSKENITVSFKSTVSVKSLGITKDGISLDKEVTLPGANKLGSPKVTGFLINQQDNNSLQLSVTVAMSNPSVFSIPMGKLCFGVSYNGTFISNMIIDDFTLTPGDIQVTMNGNASVPESSVDRANFGNIMSAYLTNTPANTSATGQYAYPDHINPVSWLTPSVQSLTLNAEIGNAPTGPPQLITGLDFGLPSFTFTPEAITFSSNNTVARYQLPFHVNTNIEQISQSVTLYDGQTPIATFNTTQFPVKDDLHGTLTMNIPPSPLNVYPGSEFAFEAFVAKMSASSEVVVNITGSSNVLTDTVIGLLPIPNLPFTLNVSLPGLSNFNVTAPEVNSVTAVDGTTAGLLMQINTTLYNPSNTSLSIGKASFEVVFNDEVVGYASSQLSLVPGPNNLTFNSSMDPAHNPTAAELLKNYMGGQTSLVTLEGYQNSTNVQALSFALSHLKLSAPLPPLQTKLIGDSTMKILDASDSGVKAVADVQMLNPFVAPLDILTINASITVDGDVLAEILDDRTKDPIVLTGNASTVVSGLPINLNLDKTVLFGLLRKQAQSVGLDTSILDALITIGKIPVPGVPPTTTIDPDKAKNFDIRSYVQTALAKITTNMTLLSTVKIGEYEMPFSYEQLNTVTHTDPSIVGLITLLSRPIAQALVDSSTLSFNSLSIQDLAENSFVTVINGGIKDAGPLPAVISFPSGADLVFNNEVLGNVALPDITIAGGQASLNNVKSTFQVKNKGALAAFAGQILSSDSVTWTVKAGNVTVNALKLAIDEINMTKDVSLKGSNGFKNAVTINSYNLPGDAPNGGITTTINATLANSGSVGITLGTVSFDIFSESTKIGEVSTSGLSVAPSASSSMKLSGRLIPQSGDGLNVIAKIFAEVIGGKAIPLITKGSGLQPPISWLVPAIKQLAIDTTLPPVKLGPLVPAVTLNELTLKFTPDTAYDPITSSKQISAQINIPFGFTLNIQEMSEEIVLVNGNTNMAKLAIPLSKAQTKGKNVTTSYSNVDLKVFDDAHDSFDSFVKDLTIGDSKTFGLVGSANTITQTPVGTFPLDNITINVQSSLLGFKGFNGKPVVISNLDVVSGTPQVLTIPIKTSLFNPSPITISVGDVIFDVISTSSGINVGHAVINNLTVGPGNNSVSVTTLLAPPSPQIAGIMISLFINNVTQPLSIVGTKDSTNVDSLKEGFSQIKISSALPPFGKRLVLSTFVQFQNDTLKTGNALGGFTIENSFTSDITISKIVQANITFHDIPLGSISDFSVPLTVKGHTTFTSPAIPIKVNLSPPNLVAIIKASAADKKVDITPLLPLLELIGGGGGNKSLEESHSSGKSPLDLLKFLLSTLDVDMSMESNVLMSQFPAPLSIIQKKVPCKIEAVDIIIFQIAAPIAQGLVNGSTIAINSSIISHEQANGFNLHINGVVNNVGKVQAKITFPSGVVVSSLGLKLGIAKLPPIISDGTGPAKIDSDSVFEITDVNNFAKFTLVLLGGPNATWNLAASDVQVEAFGIPLSGIQFNKDVPLQGFNGLKQLNVTKFELPGLTPSGNIKLAIDSTLVNPANVGIDMGTITFNVFSGKLLVGPITATNVTLTPKSTIPISFNGEITIKDPKILSQLIAQLFSGKGVLTVKGDSVSPPGAKGDVPWLSGPFKQLSLDVPISSGGPPPKPVKNITIKSLDLAFTVQTAFEPSSSSSGLVAEIQLPIKLPIPITNASQSIIITDGGAQVASLDIPLSPATQVGDTVTTTYKNIPLKAIDKNAFVAFLGKLTLATEKDFNVAGNVTASMGEILLPPIAFDVKTTMKGLQALRSSPVGISDIKVLGTSDQGITLGMNVTLTNPSDVQVSAGDITLDVIFKGQIVGKTTIQNIVLARGKNNYPATFLFSPSGDAAIKAGADLLGNFLTNKPSPLNIKGNGQTTNIPSLAPVFSQLLLDSTLNGLPVQLIESMTVTVDPTVLKTKTGLASFLVVNPLNVPYGITGIVATASLNGAEIGKVNVPSVPPIIVDPASKKNVTGIPFTFTMNVANLPGLIGKTINVDIDATASADVGTPKAYKGQIHITETKVPVTIYGSLGTITTATTTTTTAPGTAPGTTTTTTTPGKPPASQPAAVAKTSQIHKNPSNSVAPKKALAS